MDLKNNVSEIMRLSAGNLPLQSGGQRLLRVDLNLHTACMAHDTKLSDGDIVRTLVQGFIAQIYRPQLKLLSELECKIGDYLHKHPGITYKHDEIRGAFNHLRESMTKLDDQFLSDEKIAEMLGESNE